MSQFQSKFHIEDDAGPSEIFQYLDTLIAESPTSNEDVLEGAQKLGHSIGTYERIRVGPTIARLGIVEADDPFTLTTRGDDLVDIMYRDQDLFNDILHLLYYTAFDRYPDKHIYTSYTYQTITNYIHDNAPYETFEGKKKTIIGEVANIAQNDDRLDLNRTQAGVSLSSKSFTGYLRFLTELSPSVVPDPEAKTPGYEPRSFCPPALFALAVDFLYSRSGTEYGRLLQTDEYGQDIRRICLLTEEGLDEVLDYTAQSYPFIAQKESFGSHIRLDKEVSLADV